MITRRNIGETLHIGDLYDARRDISVGSSMFDQIPDNAITQTDCTNNRYDYTLNDSYTEKFRMMSIEGNLKLSVLSNIVNISGVGKYLSDVKESSKIRRSSMLYEILTKKEDIDILSNKMRSFVKAEVLNDDDVTHVVTGIKWGANIVFTLEYELSENAKKKEFEGSLKATFDIIKAGGGGGGGLLKEHGISAKELYINIKLYGTVKLEGNITPQNIDDIYEITKSLNIENINGGKGIPVEYTLFPIDKVRKYYNLDLRLDAVVHKIDVTLISKIEKAFDDIIHNKSVLFDFVKEKCRKIFFLYI